MIAAKKGIMYLKPEGLPQNVLSFTTTRFSGFSSSEFSSLNFGYHVDDDEMSVTKNYEKLYEVFSLKKVLTLSQIHSNIIVDIDRDVHLLTGDGLVTRKKNVALGILTADCFNVQLVGNKMIANIHCGWKSIYSGILEECLKIFEMEQDTVRYAVVGPGICAKCYEVNSELVQKFLSLINNNDIFLKNDGKFYLDLRKIIKLKLENFVESVIDLNYCTRCNDFLYSYRRFNKTGRLLSVLMKYE